MSIRQNRKSWWLIPTAVVLVIALLLAGACAEKEPEEEIAVVKQENFAVVKAQYPQTVKYPFIGENYDYSEEQYRAWIEDREKRRDQPEGYTDGLDRFFAESSKQFLTDAEGENRIYSPVNVYMALCMLAEVTDGESREQILDLLGKESIEELRAQSSAVWNANYLNDGAVTSILASSLWLDEDINYLKPTLENLAKYYMASAYSGEMGSAQYDEALREWLNEQTGGLLEGQTENISLDPNTVMALATTVYFNAKWSDTFSPDFTQTGNFHAASGDTECEFMKQSGARNYYWSDKFSAVVQGLEEYGGMWLILPDEGVTVDELLENGSVNEFIMSQGRETDYRHIIVNLSMPKFDVSSQMDLSEGLKALGVTDVFDGCASDFSPMTDEVGGIFLSQVSHAARVEVDEEGCTAAAFTVMMACGAAMPPEEEVDFVLDRPFIFAITGESGLPLFIGIVNNV
ncbi:MAG: serpin family protein [Clostridia bacterium]|nr:serpin family protein [Clostridia bacterium]